MKKVAILFIAVAFFTSCNVTSPTPTWTVKVLGPESGSLTIKVGVLWLVEYQATVFGRPEIGSDLLMVSVEDPAILSARCIGNNGTEKLVPVLPNSTYQFVIFQGLVPGTTRVWVWHPLDPTHKFMTTVVVVK